MTTPSIAEMPKVELHLHLEGSMSVETVRALQAIHNHDMSSVWPNGIPDAFSFEDFPDFGRQYLFGLSLLKGAEDIARATDDLAAALAAQNVRWAEVTTTAFSYFLKGDGRSGMSPAEYCAGLDEGRRRASSRGVEIGWVVDIPRDLERPDSTVTIDFVEGSVVPEGLVGFGLGGYEVGFPAAPYAEHFARAKAIGLHAVPHAGETEGASSVRSAIDDLGAERIGHGVRCLEQPDLVKQIADEGIMLEVCPTSNLLLGVISSIEEHALPALRDAGVRVCINTDDPGWFATDLTTELQIASDHLGVDDAAHIAIQRDALDSSFAPSEVKRSIRDELHRFGQLVE